MEPLLEIILNVTGFFVGLFIGVLSYIGYKRTGSPTLFRMGLAFFSISTGFFVIWMGFMAAAVTGAPEIEASVHTLGIGIQSVGYFFIAFSHTLKSFFPKSNYFKSIVVAFFVIPGNSIAHIIRSISFILLVYGTIETFLSYMENKKTGTLFVGSGLGLLALGEFLGWYSIIFPGSILYFVSVSSKIAGLGSMFVPISRITIAGMRFGSGV